MIGKSFSRVERTPLLDNRLRSGTVEHEIKVKSFFSPKESLPPSDATRQTSDVGGALYYSNESLSRKTRPKNGTSRS
jgi:hypothetical protein